MSDRTPESASGARALPDSPNLEWLRKQAKRLLRELRATDPAAKLADAQFDARESVRLHQLAGAQGTRRVADDRRPSIRAGARGRRRRAATMLDANPVNAARPREAVRVDAAPRRRAEGQLDVVDLLLSRGLDANTRERGDDTYAMHWAAAHGHLDVVRRLADAGGDVVGRGDDHELEVIGWASVWDGCDDAAHREVADFLVSRGARHHIFSAIAHDLADEVRRIVRDDPASLERRMSRNENHRTPLQFAVLRNRPAMAALLLELGADPFAVDDGGQTVAVYANVKDADRPAMEAVRRRTLATPGSARRGDPLPLVACLARRLGHRRPARARRRVAAGERRAPHPVQARRRTGGAVAPRPRRGPERAMDALGRRGHSAPSHGVLERSRHRARVARRRSRSAHPR